MQLRFGRDEVLKKHTGKQNFRQTWIEDITQTGALLCNLICLFFSQVLIRRTHKIMGLARCFLLFVFFFVKNAFIDLQPLLRQHKRLYWRVYEKPTNKIIYLFNFHILTATFVGVCARCFFILTVTVTTREKHNAPGLVTSMLLEWSTLLRKTAMNFFIKFLFWLCVKWPEKTSSSRHVQKKTTTCQNSLVFRNGFTQSKCWQVYLPS